MRSAGLAMALAVGALVVGLLVFFLARGSGSKAPPQTRSGDAAPDLEGLRNRTADPGRTLIQRAKGTTIQWADKTDPSRKAGELSYDSLEPLEGQRYNVVKPRIRVFRADGREWDVRADKGNLYIPDSGAGALGGGAGQSVESGTLSGSVTAKLYREAEAGGSSEAPSAPATDARKPALTLVTDTFEFDGETYEMDAPGKVRIFGEGIDSEVNGVTLLFSEVKQRIELLRTRGGGWAKLTPQEGSQQKEAKPAETPAPQKSGATPGATPAAPGGDPKQTPAPPAPVDTWYRAVLSDGVVLEQDGRKLEAQTATALAHVIDGAFKPGAFGDAPGTKPSKAPASDVAAANTPAKTPPPNGAASQTGASNTGTARADGPKTDGSPKASDGKPVLLTWDGPLELRPVEEKPGLLAQDEMAVRFERPGGLVNMTDTAGKAEGTARIVDYFATRREARLTGNNDATLAAVGTPAEASRWGVNLTAVDAGTLRSNDLGINLDTGIAVVQGAAEIEGLSGSALTGGKTDVRGATDDARLAANPAGGASVDEKSRAPKARIAWTDRGEFHFARDAAGHATSALDEAYLYGGVFATDGQGELRGEVLRAVFESAEAGKAAGAGEVESPKGKPDSSVRLSSLLVEKSVKGLDGKGGELAADQLDVGFERTPSGKTEPKLVVATGRVKGSRRTSEEKDAPVQTLEAASLTATLADNAKGSREIDEVKARGAVRFADGTGVRAEADELDGRMREEHVTLRGRQAVVSKGEPDGAKALDAKDEASSAVADSSSVRGRVIEIDGKARTLVVPGAGRFDHRETKLGVTKVSWAEWDREMKLDDAAGTLVASGNARAESQPDPFTVEKLAGERVEMTMTPDRDRKSLIAADGTKDATPATPEPAAEGAKPERQILTASVFGAEGAPALVESRRYTTPVSSQAAGQDAARTLERLFYLESAQIDADNAKGLITVPKEGKLLFADRRAPDPGAEAAKGAAPSGFQGQVARGDALFLWKGSLVAERELNRVTFERSVRVVHLRPGDARPTEIEGERLVAELRPAAGGEAPASPADLGVGELKSAAVKGAVWARSSEGKELVGDSIFYDALAGTVDAMAEPGNEVTLFDPTSGVPVRARSILLDLTKNSFTVKQPGAITVPK